MRRSLVNSGEIYMALTSHERGFKGIKKYPEYQESLDHLLLNRAHEVCKAKGYVGLAGTPETEELSKYWENKKGETMAGIPLYNESSQEFELSYELFKRENRWQYRKSLQDPNHIRLLEVYCGGFSLGAGALLAVGGIATGIGAPIVAAGVVGLGALRYHDRLTPDQANRRILAGKSVYERSSLLREVFGRRVPHLVFSTLPCSNDTNQVEKFWNEFDEKQRTPDTSWVTRKPVY